MTATVRNWIVGVGFLACMLGGQLAHADLVSNGGFQTTDPAGTCTDWTGTTADTCLIGDTGLPSGGASSAFIQEAGEISQILGTVAGQSYDLQYRLYNDSAAGSFSWSAGDTFATPDLSGLTVADFTLFSGTFKAATDLTTLTFQFGDTSSFFVIDDISVVASESQTQVPEPTSFLLLGLALVAMGWVQRRQQPL